MEIKKYASLARISVTDEEVANYEKDIESNINVDAFRRGSFLWY